MDLDKSSPNNDNKARWAGKAAVLSVGREVHTRDAGHNNISHTNAYQRLGAMTIRSVRQHDLIIDDATL